MTHLSIGDGRRQTLLERAVTVARGVGRQWRAARIRAQVARQLSDCDDRLLRDMGLMRGDYDTIEPLQ